MFYFARCVNIIFNSLLAQLVKYDVHTTCKIKSIHATFCHILLLYETKSTEQMLHVDRIRYKKCSQTELKWCWTRKWMN